MIDHRFSRRDLLRAVACAAGAGTARSAFAQGRCMRTFGIPACNTTAIAAVFAPTGWKTTSLEHITFRVADYRKEAAFYIALMGWTIRSDDGKQAVVDSFCVGIEPWSAKTVERELKARGLTPIAETGPNGFESFHVKDLDGFDLQISNGAFAKRRLAAPAAAKLSEAAPFAPTGWKTVWLDHFSFGVSDYKKSTSFYTNLLGWKETYDEGSQNECLIGEIGDIIIRGGNPLDPKFGGGGGRSRLGIDHISFGIQPWDTDGVKAELEKRGLRAQIDTSTGDEIHVAAFKSYHTATPNGYNLQISYVTHDNRLALPNAVRPKPSAGKL